jgi:hypothetical protein
MQNFNRHFTVIQTNTQMSLALHVLKETLNGNTQVYIFQKDYTCPLCFFGTAGKYLKKIHENKRDVLQATIL